MTKETAAELFEDLPEMPAPEPSFRCQARVRTAERRQVELRPVSLEDLVPDDHRVRLVWSFVEKLDLSGLYTAIQAVEGRPGHPPADPRILVALWLFATVDGVGSAREVARLCDEHIAYQWLCGGVGMNAKTLADFRVGHGAVLERLLTDSFAALLQAGVASLERVAQDGMRVRAAAGAASFRRHSRLKECRRVAEEHLRQLRDELERDPAAHSRRQAAARRRASEDRERRVRKALEATEKLHALQQERARKRAEGEAQAAGKPAKGTAAKPSEDREAEPRASTTDPDARVMKMADGGFRPAFNVQFASDTRSGAIAAVSVDNIGSDMGKMAPMADKLMATYGHQPAEYLADGGYAKLEDIERLARGAVKPYVPVPTPRKTERDRFTPRPDDSAAVAEWRQRMGRDEAKDIYKERAATAECANAQARNHGLKQFVVRGVEKAMSSALWYALAHNMMCTWRLAPA